MLLFGWSHRAHDAEAWVDTGTGNYMPIILVCTSSIDSVRNVKRYSLVAPLEAELCKGQKMLSAKLTWWNKAAMILNEHGLNKKLS